MELKLATVNTNINLCKSSTKKWEHNMNCVLKTPITCKMDYDHSPKVVHPIPVLEKDDHFPYVSFNLKKKNTTATCQ